MFFGFQNFYENFSDVNNIKRNSLINKYLSNSHVNTLLDYDDVSKNRINNFFKYHDRYDLPKPIKHKAFHYDKDLDLINEKYPNIMRDAGPYKRRPGAYGLTASFINFLEKNKNSKYAMWYEDDALPNGNIDFGNEIVKALQSLPEKGNDVYFFAYTNYCMKQCNSISIGWSKKIHIDGSHAILFTNNSINILLSYFKSTKIILPIDTLIFELGKNNILNLWEWNGYKAGEDDMICGLFNQHETNCLSSNNVIKNINFTNNTNTPNKISVIIPCIPRDIKYLNRLLISIKNQTVLPYEVIICISEIDILQSKEIYEKLKIHQLPLKIVNSVEKKNSSQNRNIGIKNANGNILTFMDADDVMHPKRIFYINKYFREYNPYIFLHSYLKGLNIENISINEKPAISDGIYVWDLLMKNNGRIVNIEDGYAKWGILARAHHGHITIRKEVADKIKFREEDQFKKGQDSIFIRDIINHYGRNKNTLLFVDIPLSGYIPSDEQNKYI